MLAEGADKQAIRRLAGEVVSRRLSGEIPELATVLERREGGAGLTLQQPASLAHGTLARVMPKQNNRPATVGKRR